MKQNSILLTITVISFIVHFTFTLFFHLGIYPPFPEFILWYVLLFYPERALIIISQVLMLETFSTPPVAGFYLLMLLFVMAGVSIAKLYFYIDSPVFILLYLVSIEVLRWILWQYVLLIIGGTDSFGVTYHLIYMVINVTVGTGLFILFDHILKRKMHVELVK